MGIPRLEALDEGPDGNVLKGRVFAAEEADEVGVQAAGRRVPSGNESGRVVGCGGAAFSERGGAESECTGREGREQCEKCGTGREAQSRAKSAS